MATGKLYVVGGPIGNRGDLTPRALETLSRVSVIACEDTRRTGLLLSRLGVKPNRLLSCFEGNEQRRAVELVARLQGGEDVALFSDSGTPLISDPGYRLVRACREQKIDVLALPGPSAVIAALSVSGQPTDSFVFEGFLPRTAGKRTRRLESLAAEERTVVVYESARRLARTLRECFSVLGERPVSVLFELTKLHERCWFGTLSSAGEELLSEKGECVIIIGRPV